MPAVQEEPFSLTSTASRIGVAHIFDSGITASEIAAYKNRYDVVWGSFNPAPWRAYDPNALVSRYYIMEEDNISISGRTVAWWKAHYPSWILYACTPSGAPTTEIAYTPGVGFADVPLDIHNPSVRSYQMLQSLIPYVVAHNYNAIALDQVLLSNVMLGGNPRLGQSIKPGYYGCGIWEGSRFVRRYSGPHDSAWTTDVLTWVRELHSILKTNASVLPHHLSLIINHPANAVTSSEEEILGTTDVDVNETGYSDYGHYTEANRANLFATTLAWTKYAESRGVRVVTVDKYTLTSSINASQVDFALASYLMGNNGAEDLVVAGTSYSVQPYYSQFAASLGAPCGAAYGGPSYDRLNPHIYYRRFADGIAVLNSGSLPRASEVAHLPGLPYRDVLGRVSTNPLTVRSSDAYTLRTTAGRGCI